MYHIAVDDLRNVPEANIIFRTAELAKHFWPASCQSHSVVLYLDHDLGENCMNGCEFLKWILYYHLDGNQDKGRKDYLPMWPYKVKLITSNPVGRENIRNLLRLNGYDQQWKPDLDGDISEWWGR